MFQLFRVLPIRSRCSNSFIAISTNEYSASAKNETLSVIDKVEYPIIEPMTSREIYERKQKAYYEKFNKISNVEEKLVAINLPRYYGWPSYHLKEHDIPYDYLPFTQFITGTVIKENDKLPLDCSNNIQKELLDKIKTELEKIFIFEYFGKKFKYEVKKTFEEFPQELSKRETEEIKLNSVINQVNSAIIRILAPEFPHLFSAMIDFKPRIEAFWRAGGFYPSEEDKELRKTKFTKEFYQGGFYPHGEEGDEFRKPIYSGETKDIEEPIDRYFQYFGSPILQLRSKIPLLGFPKIEIPDLNINENESNTQNEDSLSSSIETKDNTELTKYEEEIDVKKNAEKLYLLQQYKYEPSIYLGIPRERTHGAIIPGFWPDDPHRFGLLSYLSSNHLLERPDHWGEEETVEALHAQAVFASFAWTLGQAFYQGFVPYQASAYPFTTQTIITNGKMFSFYLYQFHTAAFHSNNNKENNKLHNDCYATKPQELFASVNEDKVVGWNDDVLLSLLSMYMNVPVNKEINLTPYLREKEKYCAQIENSERRMFVHNVHRRMTSHRPRHYALPEIWDYERIFKIENKRRVKDARKRFFEKLLDPLNDKRFDDHPGKYIPKMGKRRLRAQPRNEKKYYPELHQDYPDVV